MKKLALIFIMALGIIAITFAQIPENLNIQKIEEEVKTSDGIPYTMTIEYLPSTGEAFFTYSTNIDIFDQDDAVPAIRYRATKFMEELKEDGQRKYYHYVYRGDDSTKYDAANKKTHYTSRIRFVES